MLICSFASLTLDNRDDNSGRPQTGLFTCNCPSSPHKTRVEAYQRESVVFTDSRLFRGHMSGIPVAYLT